MERTPPINIVLFGSGGVGKSASTLLYVSGIFVTKYDPTIEESYLIQMQLDSEVVDVVILDTYAYNFPGIVRNQICKGDGFIVMYSIINKNTCEDLVEIVKGIDKMKDDFYPLVIVGNKCDLENEREVESDRGIQLAAEYNAPFFETSAKFNINITEIFQELTRIILRSRKKRMGKCIIA